MKKIIKCAPFGYIRLIAEMVIKEALNKRNGPSSPCTVYDFNCGLLFCQKVWFSLIIIVILHVCIVYDQLYNIAQKFNL